MPRKIPGSRSTAVVGTSRRNPVWTVFILLTAGVAININTVMNRTAFVYALTCLPTGEAYVGCTFNYRERIWRHRNRLMSGAHHSPRLQSAWLEHGPDAFAFSILEKKPTANRNEKIRLEAKWISSHGTLNQIPAKSDGSGFTVSARDREKRSMEALQRIESDPAYREFLTERGMQLAASARSEEGRQAMAMYTKRRWQDPEQRAGLLKGVENRWADPDARERQSQKMREAATDESRAAHAVRMEVQWADPNSGLRNRKQTRWADPEAKARQAEKMRAAWARRKAVAT